MQPKRIGMTLLPFNGNSRLIRCYEGDTIGIFLDDEDRKQVEYGILRLKTKDGKWLSLNTPVKDGLEVELVVCEPSIKLKDEDNRPGMDVVDSRFEQRYEEILKKIPPSWKKGDKIYRREIAESIARVMRGDLSEDPVSEEELQKALQRMDWNDKRREAERAGRSYWVCGVLCFMFAVAAMVFGLFTGDHRLQGAVWLLGVFGVAFWAVGGMKRDKKMKDLPEPPQF